MNKLSFIVAIILFYSIIPNAAAQAPLEVNVLFCGYSASGSQTTLQFTREEIDNCDLVLRPDNPMYTIQSFEFTIVPRVIADGLTRLPVSGDRIPSEYRTILIEKTKHIFIEKILAISQEGSKVYISPFVIRIQAR